MPRPVIFAASNVKSYHGYMSLTACSLTRRRKNKSIESRASAEASYFLCLGPIFFFFNSQRTVSPFLVRESSCTTSYHYCSTGFLFEKRLGVVFA